MCGIVGYIGKNNNSLNVLISGLERLEYRGYDSAGVSYFDEDNNKQMIIKEKGRIEDLKKLLDLSVKSNIGIGHTRWATHGVPVARNAHPHKCGKVTIVHNGIIENYMELKEELKEYDFISETDTEVACALLDSLYNKTNDVIETIKLFKKQARGSYAILIMLDGINDRLYAIKQNSPLIIGLNENENYVASDVPAILKYTNKYIILDDGEFAQITSNKIEIYDKDDASLINKEVKTYDLDADAIDKLGFSHFMLKEINEQPEVIKKIIGEYIKNNEVDFDSYIPNVDDIDKIVIVACGSAVHAGLVGQSLLEEYAKVKVEVEIASEFRYKKNLFIDKKTLVIAISQSGETADTLEALKLAKSYGCHTLGIINVKESSIARICDKVLYINAGIEIAVATTKAYLGQVFLLSLLTYYLANKKGLLNETQKNNFFEDLNELPIKIQNILVDDKYKKLSEILSQKDDVFFIGRQIDYALCMEGSLKLKEISYIHSEAYAGGELKHGTISLIDKTTPVIAIVTKEEIKEKSISNIKEVISRGAFVILVTNNSKEVNEECYNEIISIPSINPLLQPLITVVPLQLISYETALCKDCDIDKPRNLAKSVTVE